MTTGCYVDTRCAIFDIYSEYEISLKGRDYINTVNTARDEGLTEGMRKAIGNSFTHEVRAAHVFGFYPENCRTELGGD